MDKGAMHTFGSVFDQNFRQVRDIVASTCCPSAHRLEQLLTHSRTTQLGFSELAELLEIGRTPGANEQFEQLRSHVMARWRSPEGNSVRHVAPIYVSSFCADACAYCNFSALRKGTVRKRLSLDELQEEMETVLAGGARVIELVLGSDPALTTHMLARYIEVTAEILGNEPGAGVLLCSEYLSGEAYRALKDAGLTGVVQWDETLDPEVYSRWHGSSRHKRNFYGRMDNHDRAQAAGLVVATGALLGLSDYRFDVLMQILKAQYLASEYGRRPFVFGVPRLRPIGGIEPNLPTLVADRAYETALMVYRLALPQVGRWLQTRETFAMNLSNLLDGDVFTYRCGEVRPGGYQLSEAIVQTDDNGQFGVNELERPFVERELTAHNFRINYRWPELS
jgi:2-iminoacetate synthase